MKGKGNYAENQKDINQSLKDKWDWRCERCGHEHNVTSGHVLTVHHLDLDKGNNADWNLACLCQRCHLAVQGKVFMPQFYMFEHSDWMVPHLTGYYESIGLKGAFAVDGGVRVFTVSKEVLDA